MNCRPRVWCSKYHFFNTFYRFRALKTQKNNTWNIRCLVDESFVPSAKRTSVLYCRLTDFKPANQTTKNIQNERRSNFPFDLKVNGKMGQKWKSFRDLAIFNSFFVWAKIEPWVLTRQLWDSEKSDIINVKNISRLKKYW